MKNFKMQNSTCSPSFEKLAERMEGETMMSFFENLSTREVALITVCGLLQD